MKEKIAKSDSGMFPIIIGSVMIVFSCLGLTIVTFFAVGTSNSQSEEGSNQAQQNDNQFFSQGLDREDKEVLIVPVDSARSFDAPADSRTSEISIGQYSNPPSNFRSSSSRNFPSRINRPISGLGTANNNSLKQNRTLGLDSTPGSIAPDSSFNFDSDTENNSLLDSSIFESNTESLESINSSFDNFRLRAEDRDSNF